MAYIGRDTDKISNVEVLDNITFDGSSSYTLQKSGSNFTPSSANTLLLSIDGVVQAGNFTVSGSTIDFGTAVAGTSTCDFILHYGVGLITSVSDGTVTTAKLADSSVSLAKLTATGTKDATTFLRGDNTFAEAGGSGRILQTVGASDTTTRSTTSTSMGGSPTTGLDINITPSSSSSKILVLVNAVGYSDANGGSGYYTIYRDSSDLGNLNRGLAVIVNDAGVNTCVSGVHMKVIDSPNTTSSVNYKVVFRAQGGGTAYLGFNLMKSYIYALEIGA